MSIIYKKLNKIYKKEMNKCQNVIVNIVFGYMSRFIRKMKDKKSVIF